MKNFLGLHKKLTKTLLVTVFMVTVVLIFTFIYPLLPAKSVVNNDDIRMDMAKKYLQELGRGAENVEIIYTYDPAYNCGTLYGEGGCVRAVNPNTIYLTPGLLKSGGLRYIIYHEYAHILQLRKGEGSDECAADKQAAQWGIEDVAEHSSYECEVFTTPPIIVISERILRKAHQLIQEHYLEILTHALSEGVHKVQREPSGE